LYCIVYIYIALLEVHTNQKRLECERPREKRAVLRERKEALGSPANKVDRVEGSSWFQLIVAADNLSYGISESPADWHRRLLQSYRSHLTTKKIYIRIVPTTSEAVAIYLSTRRGPVTFLVIYCPSSSSPSSTAIGHTGAICYV